MKSHKHSDIYLLIRKTIIEQRKSLLLILASCYGAILAIAICAGLIGSIPSDEDFIIYAVMAWFMCASCASKSFGEMTSKSKRIETLMTPASTTAKFMPRLMLCVIGLPLLFVSGWIVYEYAKIITYGLAHHSWYDFPTGFGDRHNEDFLLLITTAATSFLSGMSFFFFGSIAWPKKSFIISLAILAAVCIIIPILIGVVLAHGVTILIYSPNDLLICINIAYLLIATLFYTLSYRKFQRACVQ